MDGGRATDLLRILAIAVRARYVHKIVTKSMRNWCGRSEVVGLVAAPHGRQPGCIGGDRLPEPDSPKSRPPSGFVTRSAAPRIIGRDEVIPNREPGERERRTSARKREVRAREGASARLGAGLSVNDGQPVDPRRAI
jgi:hypothetical protein